MVGHQAVGMYADGKALGGGIKVFDKFFVVPVTFEDFTASVAAVDHMVEGPRVLDAQRTCH